MNIEPKTRGRPRKYNTDEERKEAKKKYDNKWYYSHHEQVLEAARKRNAEIYALYKLAKQSNLVSS